MRLSYVTEYFEVSPQFDMDDMQFAAGYGFETVINCRPDGEDEDQLSSRELETAAKKAGIKYYHIPTKLDKESRADIEKLSSILKASNGKIVGFCKSGMRARTLFAKATNTTVKIRKCGFCN